MSSQPLISTPPPSPTLRKSLKTIFTNSRTNVLLIFVPLGHIAFGLKWSNTWVFVLNFLAIIPLAMLFEFAAENDSLKVGRFYSDFLNATLSNTVESIVFIAALIEGQIRVVQASILGSIISNILLVLGMKFFAGGFYHKVQTFNMTAAQMCSSLMVLACISLIIPAAFISFVYSVENSDIINNDDKKYKEISNLSYGTAIILLIIYILYLLFQLKTHQQLYQDEWVIEDDEQPQLDLRVSLSLLAVVIFFVAFSAEHLADSIEGIVESHELNKTFVGLILIPNIKKISEIICILTSMKKEEGLDFAIRNAVDSSIDGESNWLKGAMFLATYVIIAIATYFYPN
ncbi:hypothetical protein C1646_748977 [Rhizophagus diaphanus]|nr:hypothetical protein C1646_748977 [Rhizophagus diaphanus] [Rhizophagus sp. MUCL 43196]